MIENLNGTEQLCRAPHKMCLSLAKLNWLENQSPYKTVLLQQPINVLFNGYTKGHKIACLEYIFLHLKGSNPQFELSLG